MTKSPLWGALLALLAAGVPATVRSVDADAESGGSATHALSRKEADLDLEGNVVPGAYTMAIEVGTPPQSFEVVVDTGSANLILLGDSSLCDNCADEVGRSLYRPSASSTARLSDETFSIHYGQGALEARRVSDRVAAGELPAIDYDFGVMTHQAGIQNILGLAYQAVAEPRSDPPTPYFDELVDQAGIADEFSILLCPSGQSAITLGASNTRPTHYLELAEESWYVIAPRKMQLADGKGLGRFRMRAVVDSGTTELLVSAPMHAEILRALAPAAERAGIDLSRELIEAKPGAIAGFPTLQIVAEDATGESITLDIAPETYFRKVGSVGYLLAIGITNTRQVLLGQVFMENYLVVFDRANRRIGLASNEACD